jgi:hypothetical protein
MRAPDRKTQLAAGKAVGNLLLFEPSCAPAAVAGALSVVKVLSTLKHARCEQTCAHALTFLSQTEETRALVARGGAAPVLVLLCFSDDAATAIAAVRAVCALAYHAPLRGSVVRMGSPCPALWWWCRGVPTGQAV